MHRTQKACLISSSNPDQFRFVRIKLVQSDQPDGLMKFLAVLEDDIYIVRVHG